MFSLAQIDEGDNNVVDVSDHCLTVFMMYVEQRIRTRTYIHM